MYEQVEKPKENKNSAVASSFAQKKSNVKQSFGFVDDRSEVIVQRKLQEVANNRPQVEQAAQSQAIMHNYSVQQKNSIQKKENNSGLLDNLKAGMEKPSVYSMDDVKNLPVQRKLAYAESPKVDEENTINALRQTQNGKALVETIEKNGHTCTVLWAGPKDTRYAEPASTEDAKDPLKGSDVKVNIPKIEDDYGKNEKNQKLMVDQFQGDNKQTAIVVAHHELVHARAAMEGKMESGKNEVVHTVWKKMRN